jgi:hypothetical protein
MKNRMQSDSAFRNTLHTPLRVAATGQWKQSEATFKDGQVVGKPTQWNENGDLISK